MKDKTYCTCTECPFKNCDAHSYSLKNLQGYYSFADLYKVCLRYIKHLIKEV